MGSFCTSIHCIDGRIQIPVLMYLTEQKSFLYVDSVTRPGPCKLILRKGPEFHSIVEAVRVSLAAHDSSLISVAGHHSCAANPLHPEEHVDEILESVDILQALFPSIPVIGVYVDEQRCCIEVR